MRYAARVLCVIFLLLAGYLLLAKPVHAQYYNPYITPNTDSNVPASLHTLSQSVVIEVLSALTCQIIGIDPMTNNHQCLGIDTKTGKLGYVPSHGGAVGFMGNMIADLFTPPIHSTDFVRYMAGNFGIVKHAYAQNNGIGFTGLTPVIGVWTTFRNIAYMFFVIVFIVVGFAIMLRVKIDPRTVMTIENQIPKIIIALILVTFSFAISGFLIDLMYTATYLTVNIVASSNGVKGVSDSIHRAERQDLAGGNPFGFANDILYPDGIRGITAGASGSVKDIVQNLLFVDLVNQNGKHGDIPLLSGVIDFFASAFDVIRNGVGWLIGIIASLVAFFVIAIAILVSLFRLWFSLILTYISILLEITLAPFFILFGLFPGSKIGFGSWIKSMIGNLLAFPVIAGLFVLADVFMNSFARSGTNIFIPPLIGNTQPGNGVQSPLAFIIALGFIMLAPNVVNLTRELTGAGENKLLGLVGAPIAGAFGTVVGVGKNIGQTILASREYVAGPNGFQQRSMGRAILGSIFGR